MLTIQLQTGLIELLKKWLNMQKNLQPTLILNSAILEVPFPLSRIFHLNDALLS